MSNPIPMDVGLKLFSLVNGRSLLNAFEVDIDSTTTVGRFKKVIKNEKHNDFKAVDVDKLTLWLVEILEDKKDFTTLDELQNKEKLTCLTTTLAALFPMLPNDMTCIMIERPISGTQKIAPDDHIDPELQLIMSKVSQVHKSHSVDLEKVQEYQWKVLGYFCKKKKKKKTLPYVMTESSIHLQMLGNLLRKEPLANGSTLLDIVKKIYWKD